jgi:hypothetical protein
MSLKATISKWSNNRRYCSQTKLKWIGKVTPKTNLQLRRKKVKVMELDGTQLKQKTKIAFKLKMGHWLRPRRFQKLTKLNCQFFKGLGKLMWIHQVQLLLSSHKTEKIGT